MKKLGYLLLGSGGLVLVFYLYNQFTVAAKFTYQIIGITVANVSAASIQLLVGFRIFNKSVFSAHLTNVNLKVFVNNADIATITNNLDIIIPSNGSGDGQVVLTLSPGQLELNLLSIVSDLTSARNIPLDIVGNFTLKTMLFPLKIPVKYSTTSKDLTALYNQNF